jgi:hypothetical protein
MHLAASYYRTKKEIWQTLIKFVCKTNNNDYSAQEISNINDDELFAKTAIIRSVFNDVYGVGCLLISVSSIVVIFSPQLQMILNLGDFINLVLSHNAFAIAALATVTVISFVQGISHLVRGLTVQHAMCLSKSKNGIFNDDSYMALKKLLYTEQGNTLGKQIMYWAQENDRALKIYANCNVDSYLDNSEHINRIKRIQNNAVSLVEED